MLVAKRARCARPALHLDATGTRRTLVHSLHTFSVNSNASLERQDQKFSSRQRRARACQPGCKVSDEVAPLIAYLYATSRV